MKKLISMSMFAGVAMVLFTSCEKNYVCTCTVAANGSDPAITTSDDLGKMTYSEARSKCKDKEGSVFGVSKTCKLD